MKKLITKEAMRESDAYTIKNETPSKELMRRAGTALFESAEWGERTAVVCGGGNNAGDGYVLAANLKMHGKYARLLLTEERFSEDGKYYFDECVRLGIEHEVISEDEDFSSYDTIADCVYGTGFHGEMNERMKRIAESISKSSATVVSCDIPSGLDGTTGLGSDAVKADVTVSIGCLKTGHILNNAKDKTGRLVNCDIGITEMGDAAYLLEKEDFYGAIPQRRSYSHKGNYGYTAVCGGSVEYSGAVKLANLAMASLKAGCGVSRIIVPDSVAPLCALFSLETTVARVPDDDGKMLFDKNAIDGAFSKIRSAAVGMGWGSSASYFEILSYILKNYEINLVLDADALNTISAADKSVLNGTKCRLCLTPHVAEFSRLSGAPVDEIIKHPITLAKDFAREYGVVLLLKGTASVITDGEDVFLTNAGTPGMATAGSGDVLSGILSGLFGYLSVTAKNAALGAWISGRAGELAEADEGAVSMSSGDTMRKIPEAIKEITKYATK